MASAVLPPRHGCFFFIMFGSFFVSSSFFSALLVIVINFLIHIVNVLIITALATLFAFVYNISSGLVGGLHVTLTDE